MVKQQYPTAKVSPVQIGHIIIEGLKLEDGTYAIAVVQVANLFGIPQMHAARNFCTILEDLSSVSQVVKGIKLYSLPDKDSSDIFVRQVVVGSINSKPISVLTLDQFEKVVLSLDEKGNERAHKLIRALFGFSLKVLFSDAFGDKFGKDEWQKYLEERTEVRREGRWVYIQMRKEIDGWIIRRSNPEFYQPCLVPNTINAIYKAIFGRTCQELRESWGISKTGKDGLMATREAMTKDELLLVQQFESYVTNRVRSKDINPLDAVDEFKRILVFKPVTR